MNTKIKKVLKPIEIDVSFKYICPNCGHNFWLFLREVQIKNFKIVCECGTISKPKRIKKIEIVYSDKESVTRPVDKIECSGTIAEYPEYVSRAIKMMQSLGYSEADAQKNVLLVYNRDKIENPGILVKKAINNIGENNV